MSKPIPAVSIIIPMYNTEKYIGECLDSILNQTFTDYEVIVVDDCSTDKSCEVVESYLPKFNRGGVERLYLFRSKVNSGGRPGIPRNTGIRFSRGEYIMFVDSDDAITSTALEELYGTAKDFNADVIHCEKCYETSDENFSVDKNFLKERIHKYADFVTQPTPFTKQLDERIKELIAQKFDWSTYTNLVRRDFVLRNNIKFANVKMGDDIFFTIQILTLADEIVRVPNIFYVYRMREGSLCSWGRDLPVEVRIERWTGSSMKLINLFDEFFRKHNFFQKYVNYKYAIFNLIAESFATSPIKLVQIPAHLLDSLIRRELSEVKDKTALTAFLFARMNVLNVQLIQAQNLLRQQPKEVQDFQRQNEIIQRQQAQIQQLQQQLRNVHDVFR